VEEEGSLPLRSSSTCVVVSVRDEVDLCYCFIIITCEFWLKLCGCRRQSVPGDINEQYGCEGSFEQLNLNMQAQSVRLCGC
jgi:hypothetical protein